MLGVYIIKYSILQNSAGLELQFKLFLIYFIFSLHASG